MYLYVIDFFSIAFFKNCKALYKFPLLSSLLLCRQSTYVDVVNDFLSCHVGLWQGDEVAGITVQTLDDEVMLQHSQQQMAATGGTGTGTVTGRCLS